MIWMKAWSSKLGRLEDAKTQMTLTLGKKIQRKRMKSKRKHQSLTQPLKGWGKEDTEGENMG